MKKFIAKLGEYINNHNNPVAERVYYFLTAVYYHEVPMN